MFRTLRLPLAVLGLLIALIGATAAPASAQYATQTIEVSGTASNGETFAGVIVDARFEVHDIAYVTGQLEGTVTVAGVEVEIDVEVFHNATVLDSTTCDQLDFVIAPIADETHGIEIQLDTISLEKQGGVLGGLFRGELDCALGDLLTLDGDALDLEGFLNEFLGS